MIHRVILVLLLLVAGALGVAMWRVEMNRPPNLREILEGLRNDKVNLTVETHVMPDQQTMTNSWKTSNGMTVSVVTPREPDETPEHHAARHKAACDALAALYPPVP